MDAKIDYPVQMASIKKDDYRLSEHLGKSEEELAKIENKLWRKILAMAQNAKIPSKKDSRLNESRLIGYGWEYSVYELESGVCKLPRGIFPEVNDKKYLENSKQVYEVCKKYLDNFILDTRFERINLGGKEYNLLLQKMLQPSTHRYVKTFALSKDERSQLIDFSDRMLDLLSKLDWIPDINLHETEEGDEKVWVLRNFSEDKDGNLKLFDFTAYYDVFRLYPQRTKEEVLLKGHVLNKFLKELKK